MTRTSLSIRLLSRATLDAAERRAAVHSLIVVAGGQVQKLLGVLTSLALRWWLDPARLGVYSGLRLFLDNTNRSSLGVGLGAVQEIPILRAAGRNAEAQRVMNVAHTANTLTCLIYAVFLAVLASWSSGHGALATEWAWGLAVTSVLVLLKRYESFLIAVLRAHQEFALTTEIEILEGLVSALAISAGLLAAGFWGLLAAVGAILIVKIGYLRTRHTLRFAWEWDWPLVWRLMRVGLPILANTTALGCLMAVDRVVLLNLVPSGEQALGLYSIALLGAAWCLDLGGRVMLVLYPYFQTSIGRGESESDLARRAERATWAQVPVLLLGAAAAFAFGPAVLGMLMPRFASGLPALRWLLPGTVLLSLSWPARQMLIATGRPWRLCVATCAGLAVAIPATVWGAMRGGLPGVAAGVSAGYAATYVATTAAAFLPYSGARHWFARHAAPCAGALALTAWLAASLNPA